MLKNYKIKAPYFEIGPKCFMWGERMLKLAQTVDKIAEKYDQFRFLREKKAEGKAKRIGFSYHDNAALLDRILTDHPEVDVVQLFSSVSQHQRVVAVNNLSMDTNPKTHSTHGELVTKAKTEVVVFF